MVDETDEPKPKKRRSRKPNTTPLARAKEPQDDDNEDDQEDSRTLIDVNWHQKSVRFDVGGWDGHILILVLAVVIVIASIAGVIFALAYLAQSIGFRIDDSVRVGAWLILCFFCWLVWPPQP